MYDIDAGRGRTLRFDAVCEVIDADQAEAIAHREMTEATMRWVEARMKAQSLRDQSRPIPVSPNTLTMSNDFWDHRHRVMAGENAMIARADGSVESVGQPTNVIRGFLDSLGFQGS